MRVRTLSPQSILHHISFYPNHSKRLLWLPRPMYSSTHEPLYLSIHWPKSSKIYRCWIVWGKNIRVAIIPLFLAIAYLGQSSYPHLISRFQFIASSSLARVTWRNDICTRPNFDCCLGSTMIITSLATSMAVNALGDGLDILKVFLDVNPTFEELRIKLGSNGGTKLRHIIFVIIESGMLLFAIQLIRVVLYILSNYDVSPSDYIIVINQMFNVIIRSVHSYLFCLLITFTRASHQQ